MQRRPSTAPAETVEKEHPPVWRERRIGEKVANEVASIATSLDTSEAPPARLPAPVGDHGPIENHRHHVRDVPFDEDRRPS